MPEEEPLSYDGFLALAAAAGIDVSGAHGEELFSFVQNTLAGLKSLQGIDVAGGEPSMAFIPPSD
jgi:hypothetical protein